MDALMILGAAAVGLAVFGSKKRIIKSDKGIQKISPQATLLNPADSMREIGLPDEDWPDMVFDIPFAAGNQFPVWPTITNHKKKYEVSYRTVSKKYIGNMAWRFMASRDGG